MAYGRLIDVNREAVNTLDSRIAARTITPMPAIGTAHHRLRGFGERAAAGSATTICCCVSVTDFTVHAAWVAGLALVALLCVGWRKTARAAPRVSRGLPPGVAPSGRPPRAGIAVTELAVPGYKRTPIWRRAFAFLGTGFLAVLTGAIMAVVAAFAVSWAVTTLSSLLKK